MRRTSIPHVVLAATLALLLPLEQVYCACMGSPAQPTSVTSRAGHECCGPAAPSGTEQHSRPGQAPHTCTCPQLAVAAVPAIIGDSLQVPALTPLAVLTVPATSAQVSFDAETTPALDVGSPSLPDDPGAHGLRAPPVSA